MIITKFWENNKQNIVPLCVCSLYLFILLVFLKDMVCFQSDDSAIVMILKDGVDGISHPNAIFLSPLLSKTLHSLYKLKPSIPWYFITLYTSQFIGLFLGIKLINNSTKTIFLKFLLIFSFLSLTFFIFIRVNFASASLFLFFECIFYLAYRNIKDKNCGYQDYFLGILLALSYLIRPDILKVGLVISLPFIIYFIFKKPHKRGIIVVISLLSVLLISFCIGQTNEFKNKTFLGYKDIQNARSLIIDTNIGDFNKNTEKSLDTTKLLKSDYYMLQNWWTFDQEIYTKEKLKTIVDDNFTLKKLISINLGVAKIPGMLIYLLLILLIILLLFSNKEKFVLLNSKMNKKRIKMFLTLSFFYTLSCIFLLSCIRFPLRIAFPAFSYLFFQVIFIFLIYPKLVKLKGSHISLIILSFFIFYISISQINSVAASDKSLTLKKQYVSQSFKNCMNNYDEEVAFISTYYSIRTNPFTESITSPNQIMIPCGWLINTPYYFEFLKEYNYSSGNDLCKNMVNNDKLIICFFESSKIDFVKFPLMSILFEEHFNNHYGQFFDNPIKIKMILDNRYIDEKGKSVGLVFFKLVSE